MCHMHDRVQYTNLDTFTQDSRTGANPGRKFRRCADCDKFVSWEDEIDSNSVKTTPSTKNKPYRRFSLTLVRTVVSVAVRFAISLPGMLVMFTKLCGAVSVTTDPLPMLTLPPIRLAVVLYYLAVMLVLMKP